VLHIAGPPAPETLRHDQFARRQRIVRTALRALASSDVDQVRISEVARDSGVALGTLYRYFASKEHLFAEVLVAWAGTLRTNISRHPLPASTDTERLTEVYHRSIRAFQRQPSLARLVATLETATDPFATEILARLAQTTMSKRCKIWIEHAPNESCTSLTRCLRRVCGHGPRIAFPSRRCTTT